MNKNISDFTNKAADYAEELNSILKPSGSSTFENFGPFQLIKFRKIQISEQSLNYDYSFFIVEDQKVFSINATSQEASLLTGGLEGLLSTISSLYLSNSRVING
jgi:hypothetical protein